MNFQFYWEKLQASNEFRKFVKENPKAYFCSGFFIIDKEGIDNQRHIDFFEPEKKRISSFKLGEKIEILSSDIIPAQIPLKIDSKINFEFDKIENIVLKEMEKNNVKNKLQKIMISLQKFKGKEMLLCTVFVSMLGILKIYIDLKKNKVVLFEKKSLFDIVRKA